MLTKDQQTCSAVISSDLLRVASTLGDTTVGCIDAKSAGKLSSTIDGCIAADERDKVAKVARKTGDDFDKKCVGTSLPPFGVTNPDVMNAAAVAKERELFRDLFGLDLDAAIASDAVAKSTAKCQQAVAREAKQCEDVKLDRFSKCARLGFKDKVAPIQDPVALAACIGDDPNGAIAKQCDLFVETARGRVKVDAIRKTLEQDCGNAGVDLTTGLPGCGDPALEATHDCVDRAVECRVCLAINEAFALDRDCDVFDDGVTNGSCIAPPIDIGSRQCILDPQTSRIRLDTIDLGADLEISGIVGVDCGPIDPSTGAAACTCELGAIDPLPIPTLGFACLTPAAGCPAGTIACDGGPGFDFALTATHALASCVDDAACATQCGTHCEANGAAVIASHCETDPHAGVCQCQCLASSNTAAPAGALRCNLGFVLTLETSPPCGDGDVIADLGVHCVPLSTESLTAVLADANTIPMTPLPPAGTALDGTALSCRTLAADQTAGLGLVGAADLFDVPSAGDTALGFSLNCL